MPFIQINLGKAKVRFDDLGNRNVILSGAKNLPYWKKRAMLLRQRVPGLWQLGRF